MQNILELPTRHPKVTGRRVFLDEQDYEYQIYRGFYTTQRGERLAIPVDSMKNPKVWKGQSLWVQTSQGITRPGVRFTAPGTKWQRRLLDWLRDNVNENIPHLWYQTVLGHDLHVSTWGNLYAKHWHYQWTNPFNPEDCQEPLDSSKVSGLGFLENCGWLSGSKVTDVFVNVEVGALVDSGGSGQAAEFNDFNEHEVGTNSTAESNNNTALGATSGIALAAGTQVDNGGDPPTMTTVATITADATETWEEHGVFSTSTDSLLDRSLTGGQSVASSDQVQYTYTLTVNPES